MRVRRAAFHHGWRTGASSSVEHTNQDLDDDGCAHLNQDHVGADATPFIAWVTGQGTKLRFGESLAPAGRHRLTFDDAHVTGYRRAAPDALPVLVHDAADVGEIRRGTLPLAVRSTVVRSPVATATRIIIWVHVSRTVLRFSAPVGSPRRFRAPLRSLIAIGIRALSTLRFVMRVRMIRSFIPIFVATTIRPIFPFFLATLLLRRNRLGL